MNRRTGGSAHTSAPAVGMGEFHKFVIAQHDISFGGYNIPLSFLRTEPQHAAAGDAITVAVGKDGIGVESIRELCYP